MNDFENQNGFNLNPEHEENSDEVSCSADDKGEDTTNPCTDCLLPQKEQGMSSENEFNQKDLKRIKVAFAGFVLVACIASAVLGGVVSAYLMARYMFPLTNGDFNVQAGETTTGAIEDNTLPGDVSINESPDNSEMKTEFTDIVAKTLKSVVEIKTESVQYSQWTGQAIVTGAGSGVIISVDDEDKTLYFIVTNHHVIDGASDITVRLSNGKSYKSTLVATDSITDVALLSIRVEEGTTLTVAETISGDVQLLDGQDIYVIGNPLGQLGGSVAKGIISKTARRISMQGIKMTLMQIDAAVNPGNSGGGLFDMNGRLIGIVNAKYSDEGIEGLGFAIPISTVKHVVTELASKGYVSGRPGLSLGLSDESYTTGSFFNSTTVVYPTVTNDSAVSGTYTDESGQTLDFTFKSGDIIFAVDGVSVNSTAALMSAFTNHKIGDTIKISVYRQISSGNNRVTTQEYTVSVVLTEYVPVTEQQ